MHESGPVWDEGRDLGGAAGGPGPLQVSLIRGSSGRVRRPAIQLAAAKLQALHESMDIQRPLPARVRAASIVDADRSQHILELAPKRSN